MDNQIMRARREIQRFGVCDDRGIWEDIRPNLWPGGNYRNVCKRSFNLCDPFLNLGGHCVVQEQRGGLGGAGAVRGEGRAIKQEGLGVHGAVDRRNGMLMQSALRLIYPSECLLCRDMTESDFGLCGPCWRDTPFVVGLVCDQCGVPLLGEEGDLEALCDTCMTIARPWDRGRAAMTYGDNARKMVLGLKHGDRSDLVEPAARWMARAGAPLFEEGALFVPVPLHWTRLFARRYNQAAMLAQAVARSAGLEVCVDALVRKKRTAVLRDHDTEQRFAQLQDAIVPHPKRGVRMAGRCVILIDDVMTSGATLAASCEAAHRAGAETVHILTLARAAKEP